jgi:hypothetical protein
MGYHKEKIEFFFLANALPGVKPLGVGCSWKKLQTLTPKWVPNMASRDGYLGNSCSSSVAQHKCGAFTLSVMDSSIKSPNTKLVISDLNLFAMKIFMLG